MDILYLVDRLENLVTGSARVPLVNQIMVKQSDILGIIDQMRASIPEEVTQARRVLQEKERILAQAQQEAQAIQTQAKEEAERAMGREGLLRAAEERSQEIIRRASEHAQTLVNRASEHTERLKTDADSYVAETLHNLRDHLASIETEVSRTILSIERGLASLDVQRDDQGDVDADGDGIGHGEREEDEAPQPSISHTAPRRASLATDTTGGPSPHSGT